MCNSVQTTLTRLCSNSSITSVAAISSWRMHLNTGKALIHTWQFGSFGITWFWCLYLFTSLFLALKLSRVENEAFMSRSFNKNFRIFFRVFSYDTTRNQIIVCTSAKNKFSYFYCYCGICNSLFNSSFISSQVSFALHENWTLQYLFSFSVIINTNVGATLRYLNPNKSAMSLIVTSLLQFLLCIKIADFLVFGLKELARR